jgi:hypothetical protein
VKKGDRDEDRELIAAMLASARIDVPAPDLEGRVLRGIAERSARRSAPPKRAWWAAPRARKGALAAVALAAAAAVLIVARRGPSPPPEARSPEISADPSRASAAPRVCLHGAGREPVIDDFEDGDGAIRPLEGRRGTWYVARDSDPRGSSQPLLPSVRPEATAENRYALHSQAGELLDWGASIEIAFAPPCYDASAYAGVAFSARGPGRLYLAAREVRVVGIEYGGSCTRDCYNTHAHKVDLDGTWRRFEIRWSELHQRGYAMPSLDPRSLHSLTFQVHAEDTPYDLWIDDVEFLAR